MGNQENTKDQKKVQKEAQKLYEQQTNKIPESYLIPNGAIANDIVKRTKSKENMGLVLHVDIKEKFKRSLGEKKKGDKVDVYYLMDYDKNKVLSALPLTEYDRAVADTVISLYESGITVATTATIYRALVHDTSSKTVSPKNLKVLRKSLRKMEGILVSINYQEQLMNRDLPLTCKGGNDNGIIDGRIKGRLLVMDEIYIKAGGEIVDAYRFFRKPIMYEYSSYIGQVITVPAEVLSIQSEDGKDITNNERRIAVKGYLLRRIAIMKGKSRKKVSRRILFEAVFDDACWKDTDRDEKSIETGENSETGEIVADNNLSEKERRLIREYIIQVLKYWKRISFIKDYEVVPGKKKRGVDIIV